MSENVSGPPKEAPLSWWPDGADESLVRECNCAYCDDLAGALDDLRQGISPDGRHESITAFAEGGE